MEFRVRSAICKKDEVIQDLRVNYEKAVEQNEHLEAMLQRQTKSKFLYNGSNGSEHQQQPQQQQGPGNSGRLRGK